MWPTPHKPQGGGTWSRLLVSKSNEIVLHMVHPSQVVYYSGIVYPTLIQPSPPRSLGNSEGS